MSVAGAKARRTPTDAIETFARIVVFGGSGFIGTRLVEQLRSSGAEVRVASRHPLPQQRKGSSGGLGPVEPFEADILDPPQISRAVEEMEVVINLVGIMTQRGPASFTAVHVDGARNVALAAREAGARRLIHMSALGASDGSPSQYARTKAAGERAVRQAFPEATVVRPGLVVGPGDHFFSRFSAMARYSPVLPMVGGGRTRFQPVYVDDVVEAFRAMLAKPEAAGTTYEIAGPDLMTFKELMKAMLEASGRRRLLVSIPFPLAGLQGRVLEKLLREPPLTADQVALLSTDAVASGEAPGLVDLGVTPTPVAAVLERMFGGDR